MKSSKPYLISALCEWIIDNDCTPHVLVNADYAGCEVPRSFVKDGKIVLNISMIAVDNFSMNKEALSFSARFKGVLHSVHIPMGAILSIFARETSQGMTFEDESAKTDTPPKTQPETPPKGNVKPFLRVVK